MDRFDVRRFHWDHSGRVPVRGAATKKIALGRCGSTAAPHMFEINSYDSRVLSGIAGSIGEQLRIYFNVKDIRYLHVFNMDGSELGGAAKYLDWFMLPFLDSPGIRAG